MKKKINMLVTVVVLGVMLCIQSSAFLSANAKQNQVIKLPKGQTVFRDWTKINNTKSICAKLHSVYPDIVGKTDNYTRIKFGASIGSTVLVSPKVIYEGQGAYTYSYSSPVSVKIGSRIKLAFSGNDPKLSATSVVSYDGY